MTSTDEAATLAEANHRMAFAERMNRMAERHAYQADAQSAQADAKAARAEANLAAADARWLTHQATCNDLADTETADLRAEVARLTKLLAEVKDHVGTEDGGEVDLYCLRELLAGRRCAW